MFGERNETLSEQLESLATMVATYPDRGPWYVHDRLSRIKLKAAGVETALRNTEHGDTFVAIVNEVLANEQAGLPSLSTKMRLIANAVRSLPLAVAPEPLIRPPKGMWRFSIAVGARSEAMMPIGAEPVHFDIRDNRAYVWALVDPEQPTRSSEFQMVGNGRLVEDGWTYVGTSSAGGGTFHMFWGGWV